MLRDLGEIQAGSVGPIALFRSGGCVISIKGNTVTQGEVQLGLSFRF